MIHLHERDPPRMDREVRKAKRKQIIIHYLKEKGHFSEYVKSLLMTAVGSHAR